MDVGGDDKAGGKRFTELLTEISAGCDRYIVQEKMENRLNKAGGVGVVGVYTLCCTVRYSICRRL